MDRNTLGLLFRHLDRGRSRAFPVDTQRLGKTSGDTFGLRDSDHPVYLHCIIPNEESYMTKKFELTSPAARYFVSIEGGRVTHCMKCLMISITISMAVISGAAFAGERRNIAYEDDYIWYLARGMADRQMEAVFPRGLPADVDYQIRSNASLLYHHHLIACDGPLDEIASSWSYSDVNYGDISKSDLLHFLGTSGEKTQRILARWNAKIFPVLAALMANGKISTEFPSCVNKNYVVPIKDQ
jgi:hypothetical protein